MDLVHEKTSFSPVISEAFDRSNGIYHRGTGEVIAQGELGLPIFIGVMQFTTQAVIEHRRDLEPGDIVILINDPYLGGTHLMDVKMVMPFFYRGQALVLPGQHRALAGHRRHGSGRVLSDGDRDPAGGAAPAAGQACPARRDSTRTSSTSS